MKGAFPLRQLAGTHIVCIWLAGLALAGGTAFFATAAAAESERVQQRWEKDSVVGWTEVTRWRDSAASTEADAIRMGKQLILAGAPSAGVDNVVNALLKRRNWQRELADSQEAILRRSREVFSTKIDATSTRADRVHDLAALQFLVTLAGLLTLTWKWATARQATLA